MGKSTLQNLLYKIEGYSDTPEFIITQYKECDDGTIYMELRRTDTPECKCGHQCKNAANATASPNAPNATASGDTETSGGNEATGNEAAKMGA